ncbi:MAG TPA: hypothetical protein VJ044_00960, partial [Candidatus Hodarchaeales archaeon]|nr:hypothetical protein [Candidatus Hodarchaeales archaeon]
RFPITYLLHANRPSLSPGQCPACRLGLRETTPGQPDRYLKLTAHAMWNMFTESGIENERTPPSSRPSLGRVMNLQKLVEENSPYLALKIDTLLRSLKGGLSVNPVILHPAESGAEVIAEAINDCLTSLYDYTLIAVPRIVLDNLPLGNGSFSEEWHQEVERTASEEHQHWYIELLSLQQAQDVRVILMDEFNKSGDTRKKLERLAKGFGLKVRCYFCLIDFHPSIQEQSAFPCLSLYDIEYDLAS